MSPSEPRIAAQPLQSWAAAALVLAGAAEAAAQDTARLLVRTSLRGIDTHGIARLPQYVGQLEQGAIHGQARPVVRDVHGALHCDGRRGLGQHVGRVALQACLQRAASQALVGCTLHDCGHLGALGTIVLEAAEQGCVAMLAQRTPPIMALPGFCGRAIGNNPLAFAMPVAGGPALVFDMAMSAVARGRIAEAEREGRSNIPAGWAVDEEGRPATDVQSALRGAMLPVGGHKGLGLAMLVECLAGSLSASQEDAAGGFLLLANPRLLVGQEAFEAGVRQWLGTFQRSAGSEGRYPGERQARSETERGASGVPLGEGLLGQLLDIAQRMRLPFPLP